MATSAGNLVFLSEQQLVDGDTVEADCSGGLEGNGFALANKNGVSTGSSDSYSKTKGTCSSSSCAVLTIDAKDAMSALVKLAMEIAESACGVIDHGVVSHSSTLSRSNLWKAMLSFFSLSTDCRMLVDDAYLRRECW